ncbi:MAG: hypothetical protein F6K21_35530 [Symploca sp. SIO2D2]|nr:hypothetical protein [Symploca sp. SIO2D2]
MNKVTCSLLLKFQPTITRVHGNLNHLVMSIRRQKAPRQEEEEYSLYSNRQGG